MGRDNQRNKDHDKGKSKAFICKRKELEIDKEKMKKGNTDKNV